MRMILQNVLFKICGLNKEYVQLLMKKKDLKEHESISHNKAIKN